MTQFQKYIIQKTVWFLAAFFVALVLNFYLPRLVPGNPVDAIISQMAAGASDSASMERIYQTYIHEFGLDQPLATQFSPMSGM